MYWENAMGILYLPTFSTFLLYCYHSFYKKEKKPFQFYYNMYFGLMLLSLYFFTIRAHANESPNKYSIEICESPENDKKFELDLSCYFDKFTEIRIKEELFFLKDIECLTNKQINEYQNKYNNEMKEGNRCFNEAKQLCLMIPNCTDQEKATRLYEAAIATAAGYGLGGFGGVITSLVAQLGLYLKNYFDEYRKMETLLLESKHHYELATFYQDVLDKA